MGMAEFLEKRFLGKEICIYSGEDVETITYSEAWTQNKEYFRGVLKAVDEGVLVLEIIGQGEIFVDDRHVKFAWAPPFEYSKAIHASLTRRPVGLR